MIDRRITISLGTHDAERRKEALRQLAEHLDITGRNLVPSISEAICRLADGDAAYVPLGNDYQLDGHELTDLRRMRDEAHPHTAELLTSVILAIEAAIERREGE